MKTISQRTLRNETREVLQRVEAGERLVITVDGRPVATLGPYERRPWVPTPTVRDLLRTPTDPTLLDDLRETDRDADLADPSPRAEACPPISLKTSSASPSSSWRRQDIYEDEGR